MLSLVLAAQATVSVEGVATPGRDGGAVAGEQPLAWLGRLTVTDEQSLERLAAAFATEKDPALRARAIHDWLVTRLRYVGGRDEQSMAVVFARRTATCDGYSRLFEALARAAGLEVAVIYGLARDAVGNPVPHSWNAVRLGGAWRLVDVTFDDPQLGGALTGDDGYRTDYFLVSPAVAKLDHLPNDARWLLGEAPLTRAQFLAQGAERATSRRLGLLPGPTRFEGDEVVVPVKNEARQYVLLRVDGQRCGPVVTGPQVELRCAAKRGVPHHLELFANERDEGLFRTAAEWTTP